LWEDVRIAKEVLSRQASTLVFVPLFEDDAPLGRIQIEQLARPVVESTVRATRTVIREAGTTPEATSGIFLVGGSSRMPLVASLLHHRLGVVPQVLDRPEHVVAEGCLLVEQTEHIAQPFQNLRGPSTPFPSASAAPRR
jgi:molecular chaperone DnaK (HSP70)